MLQSGEGCLPTFHNPACSEDLWSDRALFIYDYIFYSCYNLLRMTPTLSNKFQTIDHSDHTLNNGRWIATVCVY